MKKHIVSSTGILALAFFLGCAQDKSSLEARRDFAIRFNEERLAASKNDVQIKWAKDILSVLASTDAKSISNPKAASAVLAKGKNGNYGLFVFWIENHPSVNSVEFRFSNQSSSAIIPIPEAELRQIQSEAKDTIAFGCELDWGNTSELWKNLEQISSAKDLKVRLLHANKPMTDWGPVDFYKVDHWVQ